MASLIIPAAISLINQPAAIRAKKLASDIAYAQRSVDLADQSYLMVVQRNPSAPPTRYEYDKAAAPYAAAIAAGDVDTMRAAGLFTDAYIAHVAAAHPRPAAGTAPLPAQPTVAPPQGSTAAVPGPTLGPAWPQPSSLPPWAIPVGIGAVALLALMASRRR